MKPNFSMLLLTILLSAAPPVGGQARPARSANLDASRRTAIVTAAARVAPAVVSVNVLRRQRQAPQDPFAFFFMPRGSERQVEGVGSGFIISPDGVIVTNQHVTDGAQQIVVTTRDGRDYPAHLLGEDPQTDIAVLKVDTTGLPTAPIGSSDDLLIGEWVVAIGNPYGYMLGNSEPSVTAGVVSAVGRNLRPSQEQTGVYVDMIQTDAAINPGNSGGPLVNALGEVVGVNSSIFSNTGSSIGIGFAIPVERAWRVAEELRRYGRVRRAWVGLDVGGTDELRGWKQAGGLRVTTVATGSPAQRAGIGAGDVLLAARGRRLRTFLDWEAVCSTRDRAIRSWCCARAASGAGR
jgi:serine protease Do